MGRFDGKVVWVTGASAGIGRAMALEFAREDATVVGSARRVERLDGLVAEIEGAGGHAHAVPCDVTDEDAVADAVEGIVSRAGHLDVVVANAGFSVPGAVADLTDDDWRRQFDTNFFGVLSTIRHALPHLQETDGRIALMGSVAAFVTAAKAGPYNTSKAAVRALGETLSAELGGSSVSCTTIHPGFVASEIALVDGRGNFREEWKDRRPAQLMWSAEDAARVIVRAIHKRKREFVFTGHGKALVWSARHFSWLIATALARTGVSNDKG
jgi:NAD(P)-dependent dehydrogenase (short-subunit alcohol dehydrogenase family)